MEWWVYPLLPYDLMDDMIKEGMEIECENNNAYERALLKGTTSGCRPLEAIQQAMDRLWKNHECQEELLHRLNACAARIYTDLKIVTELPSFSHALGVKGTSSSP